jgi:hypothetical protein
MKAGMRIFRGNEMISQDVLMFKVFMEFIDKSFIPCAKKVYQKFGPIKQVKKLAEEHDEFLESCTGNYLPHLGPNSHLEIIDFLFLSIQVYSPFDFYSFKDSLNKHRFLKNKQYDLEITDLIDALSKIAVGEEVPEADLKIINLIYGIFCIEKKNASLLNVESCLEHMKKIVYHCERLVKYEFKE